MLKSLDELRTGLITPRFFTSRVKLQRMVNLSAVSLNNLGPSIQSAGVTTLDLEKVDERYLLFGGKNGTLAIYDLESTSGKFSYKTGLIAHLRPSPDTHQSTIVKVQWYPFDTGLFTTSAKCRNVKIWDTNCLKVVDCITLDDQIMHHDMSSVATRHNLIAVATTNPRIQLYDAKGGLATHQLKGHEFGVNCVTWSPMTENLLASGGMDKRILLWDIRSAKSFLKCLDQHNSKSFENKNNLPTAHGAQIKCIKFTDDGLHLASQSAQKDVLLWDVAYARNTLVNYGIPPVKFYFELPITFEVCSDISEPVLFIPNNNEINVYDMYTGFKYRNMSGHFSFVYCCVYRSFTQELYSGGNDMNIISWSQNRRTILEDDMLENINENPEDHWSDSD